MDLPCYLKGSKFPCSIPHALNVSHRRPPPSLTSQKNRGDDNTGAQDVTSQHGLGRPSQRWDLLKQTANSPRNLPTRRTPWTQETGQDLVLLSTYVSPNSEVLIPDQVLIRSIKKNKKRSTRTRVVLRTVRVCRTC